MKYAKIGVGEGGGWGHNYNRITAITLKESDLMLSYKFIKPTNDHHF